MIAALSIGKIKDIQVKLRIGFTALEVPAGSFVCLSSLDIFASSQWQRGHGQQVNNRNTNIF